MTDDLPRTVSPTGWAALRHLHTWGAVATSELHPAALRALQDRGLVAVDAGWVSLTADGQALCEGRWGV